MSNFYDNWLGMWDEAEKEKAEARRTLDEPEYEWIETVQDERAALLVSRETGFRTWGTTTMISEIAPQSHSGAHKHGEEAIYITEGSGYSIVDNVRYDWKKDSALLIPFGSIHQHFNNGDTPAKYISAISPGLEHFCGLHRTMQIEPWGRTSTEPKVETSPDGMAPDGRYRVALLRENATVHGGGEDDGVPTIPDFLPEFDPEHPLVLGDGDGQGLDMGDWGMKLQKSQVVQYMRLNSDVNDFHPLECEVSGLLIDDPHQYSGMHAHMEAHLVILEGHGYSLVGGEKVPWKKGTAFQVPGPQTPHRHFTESDEQSVMLRIAFGIRHFYNKAAVREYPYLYLSPRQAVLEASGSGH